MDAWIQPSGVRGSFQNLEQLVVLQLLSLSRVGCGVQQRADAAPRPVALSTHLSPLPLSRSPACSSVGAGSFFFGAPKMRRMVAALPLKQGK